MICETCQSKHDGFYGSGRFCSQKCARSASTKQKRKEINKKVSNKLKGISTWAKGIEKLEREIRKCVFDECNKEFRCIKKRKKKFCSRECANRYNRSKKSDRQKYRDECQFVFNVFDYSEKFDIELIKRYGIYTASNRGGNTNGISRDHMISVNYGYEHKINPKMIRHPANCALLRHNENMKKHVKCSITLEQLFDRMMNW